MSKKLQQKMDHRCPLKLKDFPKSTCPLAVQRLKALRFAGRELTEEEESHLSGCSWAVQHQMANYCFFKYMEDFSSQDKQPSDMEVAHLCMVSIDTVKKVERKGLAKLREGERFKEIADIYGDEKIVSDTENNDIDADKA